MASTIGKQRLLWLTIPLAAGMIVPSLVIIYLEVFIGNYSTFRAVTDILKRQFSAGNNLFLLAVFGLIPFLALSGACAIAASRLTPGRLACFGTGGLVGILILMVPAHYTVWYPLYGPGHMSSTSVVAFIFVPFYCLITLAVGLFAGWLVSLLPFFQKNKQDKA